MKVQLIGSQLRCAACGAYLLIISRDGQDYISHMREHLGILLANWTCEYQDKLYLPPIVELTEVEE